MTEMPEHERIEREDLRARMLEVLARADGHPSYAALCTYGGEVATRYRARVEALLPMLAVGDLAKRALEACEQYAKYFDRDALLPVASSVRDIGRESLEAKRTKGPWRAEDNHAVHNDGRCVKFIGPDDNEARRACAAFVAEQNEKASHDAR